MRIIDKNHDFYDYLQDPSDTIIFDRRGSFLLDKKRICEAMRKSNWLGYSHNNYTHNFITLQCGAVFWIFLATVTKFDNNSYYHDNELPEDYKLELLYSWKDYDANNELIKITVHACHWYKYDYNKKTWLFDRNYEVPESLKHIVRDKNAVDVSTYKTSIQTKKGWNDIIHDKPLLRGTGISNLIDPVEIFCAIEEHFSRIKTSSETTEPKGATNNDKIIMHGFDTKTSFRGKP